MVAIKFPSVTQLEIRNSEKVGMAFHEMTRREAGGVIWDETLNVCEIYYGRDREKIPHELINALISYCLQHLENFTKNDFVFAFKRATIEVDQFTRLTLMSFTKYLLQWKTLKTYIIQCKYSIRKQQESMNDNEIQAQKFLEQSKQVFKESFSQKEWLGTPFHASVLVDFFRNKFNESELQEIQVNTNEFYHRLQVEIENSKGLIVPTMYTSREKYHSQEMMKYAIKKGINVF